MISPLQGVTAKRKGNIKKAEVKSDPSFLKKGELAVGLTDSEMSQFNKNLVGREKGTK